MNGVYQNPFYVMPAQLGPALAGLGTAMSQAVSIKKKQERQKALQSAMKQAYDSGDMNALRQVVAQYPETIDIVEKAMPFFSAETKQNYIDSLMSAYTDPSAENVKRLVAKRQELLRREGVPPEASIETNSFLERFQQDSEGMRRNIGMELAMRLPSDKWKNLQSFITTDEPTTDIKNFKHYQTLLRENPEAAKDFALQTGIKIKKDDRTEAIKNYEYGLRNPKFVINQRTKETLANQKKNRAKTFKDSTLLRKEFTSESKDYKKVVDAYTRVLQSTANPSAAGDLSLIFNYMKMLDPNSVVRESEFATAASTGSYGERTKAIVNKIIAGERLSDKMRQDFLSKSEALLIGMQRQHQKREKTYTDIAAKNNLPIDEVVVDLNIAGDEQQQVIEAQEQQSTQPSAVPLQALEALQANPSLAPQFQQKYGYLPEGF